MSDPIPSEIMPFVSADSSFQAFPKAKTEQLSAIIQSRQPYNPPNSPSNPANKMRRSAGNIEVTSNAQPMPPMHQAPVHSHVLTTGPAHQPELVPTRDPGFTNPSSDPEAISLELPSRFAFYDFKDLYVKPFKGKQLSKLSRAHSEKSLLPVVEAVSSVLSSTYNTPHLAFQLTMADYFFVLYWLRQNSFTKSVYTHSTACKDPTHLQKVADGVLPPESLAIDTIIHKSSLTVNMLDAVPNPEIYKLSNPEIVLRPATMQDTLEIEMSPRINDLEFLYNAELASYLSFPNVKNPNGTSLSLAQRVDYIDDMSADDILTVKAYAKIMESYGVVEKVRVTCKHPECGASRDSILSLDAHSFLSAA